MLCPPPYPLPLQGNEMERMLRYAGGSGADSAHLRTKWPDWSLSLSMGEPSSAAGGYVEEGLQI